MTQSDFLTGEKPSENHKPPLSKSAKKLTWKDWLINGGILVGLLVAISALIFLRSKIPNGTVTLRTKVVIKDIQTAIESYRTEYNQFPVPGAKEDASVLSEGTWLAALLAEDEKLNPKKIRFVDLPPAMDKKRGVYQENGQPILVDYWGNKYHVVMDWVMITALRILSSTAQSLTRRLKNIFLLAALFIPQVQTEIQTPGRIMFVAGVDH